LVVWLLAFTVGPATTYTPRRRSPHHAIITEPSIWITAEVTINSTTTMLSENESTYIPIGSVHRLRNPGRMALELIEVQTGSYLGEDDMVRLEDDFFRRPGESLKLL
jgi:hypothetical protein